MPGDEQEPAGRELTEDESALFGQRFRKYEKAARKIAGAIGADPDDAVQAAAALMIDLVTRAKDPMPMAANEKEFGIAFRGLVRRIARSQVRKRQARRSPTPGARRAGAKRPSEEQAEPEYRLVSFEETLVRPLSRKEILNSDWAEARGWDGEKDRDMIESLDAEVVDGEPRDEPQPRPKYRWPEWPVDRDARLLELAYIFRAARLQLPCKQCEAIGYVLEEVPRAEAARAMGISPKTYDEHVARAMKELPYLVQKRWWMTYDAMGRCDPVYRSDWNDILFDKFRIFIGRKWQEAVERGERLQAGEDGEDAGDDDGDSEE